MLSLHSHSTSLLGPALLPVLLPFRLEEAGAFLRLQLAGLAFMIQILSAGLEHPVSFAISRIDLIIEDIENI